MVGTPQFRVAQLGCGVVGGRGGGMTDFGVGAVAEGVRKAGSPAVGAVRAGAVVSRPPAVPPGDVVDGRMVVPGEVLGDVVPVVPDVPPVPLVCADAAVPPPSIRQSASIVRGMNGIIFYPSFPSSMACFVRGNASQRAYVPPDHATMSRLARDPSGTAGAPSPFDRRRVPFSGGDPVMQAHPQKRTLEGFGAQRGAHGFIIHIIDDRGEVFEIDVSEANLATIVRELEVLVAGEMDTDEEPRPKARAS